MSDALWRWENGGTFEMNIDVDGDGALVFSCGDPHSYRGWWVSCPLVEFIDAQTHQDVARTHAGPEAVDLALSAARGIRESVVRRHR